MLIKKEIDMEELKYYIDLDNDVVFAYEGTTEFFVFYAIKANEWKPESISFRAFGRDRYYKEISREEALARTNGSSPEPLLCEYVKMLRRNAGLTE